MHTLTDQIVFEHKPFTTLTNQATGDTYRIEKQVFWVGRSSGCDVVIEDPAVSERHLRFEHHNKKWFVNDLSTKNGTFLNKVLIKRALVPAEHVIKIGRTPLALKKQPVKQTLSSPIVGDNHELLAAIKRARLACNTSLPIMILGETGTGKELFARLIHNESKRAQHPFVALNCGGVPSSLLGSELFGHQKGAFTDAKDLRKGLIERAESGSLFLDEIGELPLDMQPLLLRLTEENRFRKLGNDETSEVKCRLITATNNTKIREESCFRRDLFYRLGSICIELPPLRKRKEDIPKLLNHFLDSNRDELGKPEISSKTLDTLMDHSWPGNIRELKHVASRLAIFGSKNLSFKEFPPSTSAALPQPHEIGACRKDKAFKKALVHAMKINGSIRKSAEYLGIPKSTLAERLVDFNIN